MFVRTTLGLALTATLPIAAAAQSFAYAPGTTKYEVVTTGNGSASQMGMSQPISFTTTQRVTLTLGKKTKDTLSFAMSLDTIFGTTPQGGALDPSMAAGLKVNATMSPGGRIYTRSVPDNLAGQMAQAANQMADFLPRMPASVKMGSTWTDTTSGTIKNMGIDLKRDIVATFKVTGDTTIDGDKSWKIERTSVTTLTGSGEAMGQPVSISATSNGLGTYYVTPSGTMTGANLTENTDSKVTLVAQSMDVTTTQKIVTHVGRIKA